MQLTYLRAVFGYTNNDLFRSFEGQCPEKAKQLFDDIRPSLERSSYKLEKPSDLYTIYTKALKIGETFESQDSTAKQCFIEILKAAKGKWLSRVGATGCMLDFTPIIERINESKQIVDYSLKIIDNNNFLEANEAAQAIDHLSNEGVGWSFGVEVLKTIIQSPSACCIIATDQMGHSIGSLFGTLIELQQQSSSLKVLHIWLCARKANYPGIHFIEMLKSLETDVVQRFSPDFFSLSVDVANSMVCELYKNAGFVEVERKYNSFTNSQTAYMVKDLQNEQNSKPSRQAVYDEINKQARSMLGATGMMRVMQFKITKLVNGILYK